MRFEPMKCPTCEEPAMGTVDWTPGCALFGEADEKGNVEYCGETKMFWDGQLVECSRTGKTMLQCHEGHEWAATEYDGINQVKRSPKSIPLG